MHRKVLHLSWWLLWFCFGWNWTKRILRAGWWGLGILWSSIGGLWGDYVQDSGECLYECSFKRYMRPNIWALLLLELKQVKDTARHLFNNAGRWSTYKPSEWVASQESAWLLKWSRGKFRNRKKLTKKQKSPIIMKLQKEKIYDAAYNMIENFIGAFNKKIY